MIVRDSTAFASSLCDKWSYCSDAGLCFSNSLELMEVVSIFYSVNILMMDCFTFSLSYKPYSFSFELVCEEMASQLSVVIKFTFLSLCTDGIDGRPMF